MLFLWKRENEKNITEILKEYLEYYTNERERQSKLIEYLEKNDDNQITDWNNFNGHIVAKWIEKKKFYDEFKEMSNKIEHILKNR